MVNSNNEGILKEHTKKSLNLERERNPSTSATLGG